MPPTNTTKGTATVISSLPYSITEDANDTGVTKDLWFTYTAVTGDAVIGPYASGVSPYTPETIIVLADDTEFILGDTNTPIQLAVTVGVQYWIKCHNVGGNHATANCTLSVTRGPAGGFRPGDVLIPDDQTEGTGFPGVSLDPSTGAVVHMVATCPNGESGDVLSSGPILLQNVGDPGTTSPSMKVYASATALAAGTVLATLAYTYVPGLTTRAVCRLCDHSAFYFTDLTAANTFTLYQVSPTGVKTTADTITSTTGISAITPNVGNTKLYLSGKTGTSDSAIRTWNLSTHSYDSDFVAAIAGYININDLITLTNGRIAAVYQKNTATRDLLVKVYDSAGTVVASRSFGSAILSGASRIFHAYDDTNELWLRRINDTNTLSYFKLSATDLSTITTFDTQAFQEGVNVSADPDPDRFGTSITCAGIVLLGISSATNPSGRRGIYVPTRGVAGSEGGGSQARFQDLNGFPSTSTGFSTTAAGRIIPILAGAEGRRAVAQPGGAGSGRAIYVPTVGIAGAEGDGRISTLAQLAIRRIVVYDGEGYTHR